MARVIYTQEHHRQAYEIWRESRTYTRVAEILEIGHDTARDWAKADFNCRYGCQWHNWEALAAAEAEAVQRRMQLYEEGNVDPIAHGVATKDVMRADERNPSLQKARRDVMDKLVRSDLERAAQWELLWGKVYYQVTGICLDHRTVIADGSNVTTEELYRQGLKVTNMEGGIRALFSVQSQIDKLKERMGVYKSDVKKDEEKEPDLNIETLSIEDARKFQALVENTPPEQLELLKRMMRQDDAIVRHATAVISPVVATQASGVGTEGMCAASNIDTDSGTTVVNNEQSEEPSASASQ